MANSANTLGLQGLKPGIFGHMNVTAEAATHKDYL